MVEESKTKLFLENLTLRNISFKKVFLHFILLRENFYSKCLNSDLCTFKNCFRPDISLNIQVAEAGGSPNLRPTWST